MKTETRHLNLVKFASEDSIRYQLNGIYCEVDDGKLSMTATNGKILGHLESNSQDDNEKLDQILDSTGIKEWLKAIPKREHGIDFELEQTYSTVKCDKIAYLSRADGMKRPVNIVDATFPNYRQILSSHLKAKHPMTINVNPFLLMKCLKGMIDTLGLVDKEAPVVSMKITEDKHCPIVYEASKDGATMKAMIMPLVQK